MNKTDIGQTARLTSVETSAYEVDKAGSPLASDNGQFMRKYKGFKPLNSVIK